MSNINILTIYPQARKITKKFDSNNNIVNVTEVDYAKFAELIAPEILELIGMLPKLRKITKGIQ